MTESVITKAERERVKKLVLEAFDSVPKPEKIAEHDCEECKELSEYLTDIDWRNMESELIDVVAGDLSLLTPEAFRYFLPACIIKHLDEWLDPYSSVIFPPTIMGLVPTNNDDAWFKERYQFNSSQQHVFHEFLKLVRQDPTFHLWHAEANAGLSWYKPK
jgi:hypothetical protein